VRGFKGEPVSREVLERVLSAAAWSPSGSNIQPWNTYVLTGAPLAELKTRAVERVCHGDPWERIIWRTSKVFVFGNPYNTVLASKPAAASCSRQTLAPSEALGGVAETDR
jgi:nitroreductase